MQLRLLCVVLVLALAAGAPAHAQMEQRPDTRGDAQVQVTPFVSFGSTASSRVGAAIRFALAPKLSLETEIGYRHGEINALSAHASILYDLPAVGRMTPYVGAGIGLEEYGWAIQGPSLLPVTQKRLSAVVNAGAGVSVAVNQRWGIRTDARWMNGLGTFAPEHWRLYHGVTFRPGAR